MKNTQLVSIIVPVYNTERYLPECIDSIISQSHKNLEIILVDDGSPDNSGKIADEYAKTDERINIVHQENRGVSAARNAGLDRARGDYICFSDSDDILKPDYVEYLLDMAIQNNADIALTTEMFTRGNMQTKTDKVEIYSAEKAFTEILYYHIPIGCYCKVFKQDFLNKNNIRFLTDFFIGEGFNFNATAFQYANRIAAGHRKIYYYRQSNETSAMTVFSFNKCVNGLDAVENIKKSMMIRTKKTAIAWEYANWHTHTDFFCWMVRAGTEKEYQELYKNVYIITRTKALYALCVPVCLKDKIRALLLAVIPLYLAKRAARIIHHNTQNIET